MRSLGFSIQLWRTAFDIGVADTQILEVQMEFGLKLIAR